MNILRPVRDWKQKLLRPATPIVTVAVPAFNAEGTIDECLESIKAQSFDQLEILVSDNASTDSTVEIVRKHQRSDARIVLLKNEINRGFLYNMNRLRLSGRGEFFLFLSPDCVINPEFVQRCLSRIGESKEVVGAYTGAQLKSVLTGQVVSENLNSFSLLQENPWDRALTLISKLSQGTMIHGIYRMEAIRSVSNIYRTSRPMFLFDRLFLGPLAYLGKIHQIEEPLIYRYLDKWQLSRKEEGVTYDQLMDRLNGMMALRSARYNMPSLDSIFSVIEEMRFVAGDDCDTEKISEIYHCLGVYIESYINSDVEMAEKLINEQGDHLISKRILNELAESLSKIPLAWATPSDFSNHQRLVELRSKVNSLISERSDSSQTSPEKRGD